MDSLLCYLHGSDHVRHLLLKMLGSIQAIHRPSCEIDLGDSSTSIGVFNPGRFKAVAAYMKCSMGYDLPHCGVSKQAGPLNATNQWLYSNFAPTAGAIS